MNMTRLLLDYRQCFFFAFLLFLISCSSQNDLLEFANSFNFDISEADFCNQYLNYSIERVDLHQYKIDGLTIGETQFATYINFKARGGTRMFCFPCQETSYNKAIIDKFDRIIDSKFGEAIGSEPSTTAVLDDRMREVGVADCICKKWISNVSLKRDAADFNGILVYYMVFTAPQYNFRKGFWGDDRSTIIKRESNTIADNFESSNDYYGYDIQIKGKPVGVIYHFNQANQLDWGKYCLFSEASNCIEEYNEIKELLAEKYYIHSQLSKKTISKETPSILYGVSEELLVERGFLSLEDYYTDTPYGVGAKTIIRLSMQGDQGIIILYLDYYDIADLKWDDNYRQLF